MMFKYFWLALCLAQSAATDANSHGSCNVPTNVQESKSDVLLQKTRSMKRRGFEGQSIGLGQEEEEELLKSLPYASLETIRHAVEAAEHQNAIEIIHGIAQQDAEHEDVERTHSNKKTHQNTHSMHRRGFEEHSVDNGVHRNEYHSSRDTQSNTISDHLDHHQHDRHQQQHHNDVAMKQSQHQHQHHQQHHQLHHSDHHHQHIHHQAARGRENNNNFKQSGAEAYSNNSNSTPESKLSVSPGSVTSKDEQFKSLFGKYWKDMGTMHSGEANAKGKGNEAHSDNSNSIHETSNENSSTSKTQIDEPQRKGTIGGYPFWKWAIVSAIALTILAIGIYKVGMCWR